MNIYILIGSSVEEVAALATQSAMVIISFDPDNPDDSIFEFTGIRSICFDPGMSTRIGHLDSAEDGFAAFARKT
jgi:hypothetical protein